MRSALWLALAGLVAALAGAGCERRPAADATAASTGGDPAGAAVRFTDAAQSAGIAFRHQSGSSGRFYLPETMGSGCAFLDYDGDGRLDLFLVNSTRLPGFQGKGPYYPALYRNRGDGTFEDVTRAAGLAVECYGMGCAVGDIDNDGDPDLYLTALGPNVLFRNNGDGTFSDVTAKAGVRDRRFSTSAAFLDYDRDGRLDLFVCNYCDWSPAKNPVLTDAQGRKHMAGPRRYRGAPSTLYRNQGDGTFADVTRKAGVYSPVGKSLGVLVFDPDDDGWPDLLIANDMEPNLLYRNLGRSGAQAFGRSEGSWSRRPSARTPERLNARFFEEIGVEAGVAYSKIGQARAGMGIDSADIGNDGREAVVIGNNSTEGLGLFQPDTAGGSSFTDIAEAAGLLVPSLPFLTFGTLFVDVDNDGLKDLFAANGHVDEGIQYSQPNTTFAERPLLFRNAGGGRFQEIGMAAGPALQAPALARGVAAGDYDADGDLDLLVSVCNGLPKLLRNELFSPRDAIRNSEPKIQNANRWLAVRARGVKSNRDGLGTRVTVEAGGVRRQGWIRSGSSYCSASDLVAWFGLGAAAKAERVTLRWPSGAVQRLTDVAVDREILVEEGAGIVRVMR